MTTTIRDVAIHAGVSVATVSRALNNSGPVREETRARIQAAVKALQYRPNSAAQSLITRRTRTLGVLLPDLHGEFFSELIRGLDEAAQKRGYHLLLSSSHDLATELDVALHRMGGRVDGLVVMAPKLDAETLDGLLPRNVPVVLLNSPRAGHAVYGLRIDNRGGARAVVSHLIGHGHRRIAIITGPTGNHDAAERLAGYREALREAGLAEDPEIEVEGDFRTSSGFEATSRILALRLRPTALFASNDAMALGALSALRDAGVSVPQEMALVGFDDLSSAQYSIPPLSSVHIAIEELGTRAITRLMEVLEKGGPVEGQREVLPARPVFRRSCGCSGQEEERRSAREDEGDTHRFTQSRQEVVR